MESELPDQIRHGRGPLSPGEFVTTISHFHRAEIARMAGWRDRLDRTSNWAITVVAAMLSVSLSTPSAHHGVLLFAMLLVLLLLWIEARRYRFFDVYRARVRQLERHYFAQVFSPQSEYAANWLAILAEGLRAPKFLISHSTAFSRRLRRNYIYMYLMLLLAWVLKISTPSLQNDDSPIGLVNSLHDAVANAALGPIPGWPIVVAVLTFYVVLVLFAYGIGARDGELAHGDVHV
jgi:uncharacterized membrane protein